MENWNWELIIAIFALIASLLAIGISVWIAKYQNKEEKERFKQDKKMILLSNIKNDLNIYAKETSQIIIGLATNNEFQSIFQEYYKLVNIAVDIREIYYEIYAMVKFDKFQPDSLDKKLKELTKTIKEMSSIKSEDRKNKDIENKYFTEILKDCQYLDNAIYKFKIDIVTHISQINETFK